MLVGCWSRRWCFGICCCGWARSPSLATGFTAALLQMLLMAFLRVKWEVGGVHLDIRPGTMLVASISQAQLTFALHHGRHWRPADCGFPARPV